MAILIDGSTRAILQGITGRVGRSLAVRFRSQRAHLVAGVTPGRGGQEVEGLPVFDSCHEAVAATGANTSFVVVPPAYAGEAVLEAVDAGVKVVILYIEGVPQLDALRFTRFARARGCWVLGPNSMGVISLGQANLSEMDERFLLPGNIGVVAKSGAMCAESAHYLRRAGLGCSTIVSIGGDPILGTYHADVLEMFEADPATEAVVMVGEIGGRSEIAAAGVIARMTKPVVGTIIGRTAPTAKQMGHAGAVRGSAEEEDAPHKLGLLAEAGANLVQDVTQVGARMRAVLEQKG